MRGFADFCNDYLTYNLDITEAFGADAIMAHQVENGQWEPSLDTPYSREYYYYFSLPSDPKKTCKGKPCYALVVYPSGQYGNPGEYSVTFKHAETEYSDRHDYNQELKRQYGGDPGGDMMKSVLNGLWQFVEAKKPKMLSWSGVSKSRDDAINPNAREKVYFLWASKNLLGKYVPISQGQWVRADVYDRQYVQQSGYIPFDPALYRGARGAEKFIEKFNDNYDFTRADPNYTETDAERQERIDWAQGMRDAEERGRREAEARRQAERLANLRNHIESLNTNPNEIRMGDLVYIKDEVYADQGPFKVVGFEFGLRLKAHLIKPDDDGQYRQPGGEYDYDTDYDVRKLYKVSPETNRQRGVLRSNLIRQRIQDYSQRSGVSTGTPLLIDDQDYKVIRIYYDDGEIRVAARNNAGATKDISDREARVAKMKWTYRQAQREQPQDQMGLDRQGFNPNPGRQGLNPGGAWGG